MTHGAKPGPTVTKDGLPHLASLIHLRELSLGGFGPRETDLSFLERFQELELLSLWNTALSDWEPRAAKLPALRDLRLQNMEGTKTELLGPLTTLRNVVLSGYGTNVPARSELAKRITAIAPWCQITIKNQDNTTVVIDPTAPPP